MTALLYGLLGAGVFFLDGFVLLEDARRLRKTEEDGEGRTGRRAGGQADEKTRRSVTVKDGGGRGRRADRLDRWVV